MSRASSTRYAMRVLRVCAVSTATGRMPRRRQGRLPSRTRVRCGCVIPPVRLCGIRPKNRSRWRSCRTFALRPPATRRNRRRAMQRRRRACWLDESSDPPTRRLICLYWIDARKAQMVVWGTGAGGTSGDILINWNMIRHCERSEAIQSLKSTSCGLPRRFAPRNDELIRISLAADGGIG